MDELVRLVAGKTGLPEAQARTAVTTVIGFLKERLPAPIAGQLDAILGGQAAGDVSKMAQDKVDDVSKGIGDMLKNPFGKK